MNKLWLIFLFLGLGLTSCASVDGFIKKGEMGKAEEYCSKQKSGKQSDCCLKLGNAYFDRENYDKAGEYYLKAPFTQGLLNIGDVYLSQTNYGSSAQYYLLAGRDSNQVYLETATVALSNRHFPDSEKYFLLAGKTNEDIALIFAGVYFRDKQFDLALASFDKAGKLREGLIQVGDYYFDRKDYLNALKYYEKAEDPQKSAKVYLILAEDALSRREFLTAVEYYEKAGEREKLRSLIGRLRTAREYENQVYSQTKIEYALDKYDKIPAEYRDMLTTDAAEYVSVLRNIDTANKITTSVIELSLLKSYNQASLELVDANEELKQITQITNHLPTIRRYEKKRDEIKARADEIMFRIEAKWRTVRPQVYTYIDTAAAAYSRLKDNSLKQKIDDSFLTIDYLPGVVVWLQRFRDSAQPGK